MSSNDKIKVKEMENSCILLGTCFFVATALLIFGYIIFGYKINEILSNYLYAYLYSAIILLYMAFFCKKTKSIGLLEKKEIIIKILRTYVPLIAIWCIITQVFISAYYIEHEYKIDIFFLISSIFLYLLAAICTFISNLNDRKGNFYLSFVYFSFVLLFLLINLSAFKIDLFSKFLNISYIYIILSITIIAVNAAINRFFFTSGELEKTEHREKSVSDLANRKSSDKVENQEQTASLNYKNAVQKEPFSYIKKEQTVDEISSEFAVDVLSIAVFFGIIFGLFAYSFFIPDNDNPSFFGGIDVKTVALATAGLVTFFWAAKAAKNKSIELEEKKQDGKRRDKEIKMAEARDTAQLIAKASELLGSENDAQKYAGLSFLNTVASQKGGPLQKEAVDLLADFILSASDTTTANKPRMRAITYVNNQIENNRHDFKFDEFIGISRDMKNRDDLTINHKKYVFKNLNIAYYNFCFFRLSVILNTYSPAKVCYENCDFIGFHNGDIPDIPIFVHDCHFVGCEIKVFNFDGYKNDNQSFNFYYNFVTNTFKKCDFSGIKFWEELRLQAGEALKPENFVECYFFNDVSPDGFNADRDKKFFVGYDRQDADKQQSGND